MKKKLLIIDDQEELRNFLTRAAESLGYEAKSCENGDTGVAMCLDWEPDVVLTDIFMPDRDGLETIRDLRKPMPELPVIAMSGGGNIGHMDILRTARAMGAKIVLAKPFTRAVLSEALNTIFQTPS